MTPILFVPGLLCTAEVFAPQISACWPYGPVTVASTLEGDTMNAIAKSILETAPPTFALCGISMGGYLCFEIMRQAPERITRLALLDTSALPDTPEQTAQRHRLLAQAESADFVQWAQTVLASIPHPAHQRDAAIRDVNGRMAKAIGLEGLRRQTRAVISRPDSRPTLGTIRVPTLVLVGDSDSVTPPQRSREIAAGIAGSRLVVVPECGHSSTLEQPDAVSAALLDWLRK